MAQDQFALLGLLEELRTADGGELMRRLLAGALQLLIDAEAAQAIGAQPYERTEARTAQRNGSRPKTVATATGDVTVGIPKLRSGSFFPSLLEPRRRVDVALHAVISEAYVHGVSTRKVDDLMQALGIASGISKSEVSRVCASIDTEVAAWLARPLDHTSFPYVFCDATYVKVRLGGRVVSQAVVVATGVTGDGRREVLGHQVGDSETEAFWTEFLTGLRDRGLRPATPGDPLGVHLVITDSHRGLTAAIARTLPGTAWQRCRVHFMRNVLSRVGKAQGEFVAASVRTIFAQPTAALVRAQVDVVADTLRERFPAVAGMLTDAKTDITAFADFPDAHWRKIWSTNPIERLNREIKRRTDVVGIFPTVASVTRLVGAVLIEAHDEWQVSDRRYLSEASMNTLLAAAQPTQIPAHDTPEEATTPALTAA